MKSRESRPVATAAWITLIVMFCASSASWAYRVYLKDGSSLWVIEKYVVQGDHAYLRLRNGSQTVIPLTEIDGAKTEEFNRVDYGSATVIDRRTTVPLGGERPTTLRELIQQRRLAGEEEIRTESSTARVRTTPSGYNDLTSFTRRPYSDETVGTELSTALRRKGLQRFSIHAGTRSSRVLVDVTTESADGVFEALRLTSRAFLEIKEQHPDLEAVELLMQTASRSRGGQFLLTSDNAPLMVNEHISVEDFFMEYVEF